MLYAKRKEDNEDGDYRDKFGRRTRSKDKEGEEEKARRRKRGSYVHARTIVV